MLARGYNKHINFKGAPGVFRCYDDISLSTYKIKMFFYFLNFPFKEP